MTARLTGTNLGLRSAATARERWSALRDEGRFRGAILEGQRAFDFLSARGGDPVVVFGDAILGSVATSARELGAFLQSSDLHPEGEFFAFAENDAFSVYAARGMLRCVVSVWLE